MNPTQTWQAPEHDPTRDRTPDHVNAKIDDATLIALSKIKSSPEAIHARLDALDKEWDVDRALMALFSVLGSVTAGTAMRSLARTGKLGPFGYIFWTQMAFLLHHAVRGWCPPVAVLRRLGFRTAREISAERVALEKSLAFEDGP